MLDPQNTHTRFISTHFLIGSVRFIIVRGIDGVNKRIDDLRSQMSREHDALAKIADGISTRLDSLEDKFARHVETHP